MKRPRRRAKIETFRAVRPNAGVEAAYRQRLRAYIDAMDRSVCRWLTAAYRQNEPRVVGVMAEDAMPAIELRNAVRRMAKRWEKNFDEAAPKLAQYFAKDAWDRSDAQLRSTLKKGGFSVKFRTTAAQRDILQATVEANVALIRSIPSEYFTQIEGMVMRSVQTGRDLNQLTNDLQQQYGVTRRRAAFIARDQNNKATSALQAARQTELGIKEGIWMHSGGGKEPRPKHVKATGTVFDLSKGLPIGDKGQWVMPGFEINCRCVWRPVVPGFD